jgi:hypothetical protein
MRRLSRERREAGAYFADVAAAELNPHADRQELERYGYAPHEDPDTYD